MKFLTLLENNKNAIIAFLLSVIFTYLFLIKPLFYLRNLISDHVDSWFLLLYLNILLFFIGLFISVVIVVSITIYLLKLKNYIDKITSKNGNKNM